MVPGHFNRKKKKKKKLVTIRSTTLNFHKSFFFFYTEHFKNSKTMSIELDELVKTFSII